MEKMFQEASTKVFANKRRVINQLPNICTPNGSYVTRPSASRSVSSQCGAQPTRPSGNRPGHSLTTQGHQKHHIYHQPLSEWQWKSPLQLPDVNEGTPWQKISGCAGLEVWTQTLSEAASMFHSDGQIIRTQSFFFTTSCTSKIYLLNSLQMTTMQSLISQRSSWSAIPQIEWLAFNTQGDFYILSPSLLL